MIDSTRVVNRLQDHLNGEIELSATQVQSAKILLDKSLPSLQSADITAHSSPQIESEEALLAQLQGLIAKYPHLISQLAQSTQGIALPGPVQSGIQVGNDASTQVQQSADNADPASHNHDQDRPDRT